MRRRRRRGANRTRALNVRQVLKPASTGLTSEPLASVGQRPPQEAGREEPCPSWHLRGRQDTDEGNGLRRRRTWKIRESVKPDNDPPIQETNRPRRIRFSNIENVTLISKLVPVYEQLLGKHKSRTPFFKKSQMWQEICDAVNVMGNKQRFIHHCKKRFHDIKRQLKTKINREKSLLGDPAGPFQVLYTEYEEELKKVLPAEVIDGIEFFDSDHPEELGPKEEAGPSPCTWENVQRSQMKEKSSKELQNVSEPGLQRPVYIGVLDEQWSMFPDVSSIFSAEPSTARSMNFPTDHIDLQFTHPLGYSIAQPSPHNLPNPTSNHGAHLLKALRATQKLFRKRTMRSLNVLRSDIGHFNKCMKESNSIANNLLKVQVERNSILHQMNIGLGKLAESLEQLANQQHAEQILHQDIPRRGTNWCKSLSRKSVAS